MVPAQEIRVCLDIGSYEHHVSVGLSNGEVLEKFTIRHEKEGFENFFNQIEKIESQYQLPVSIAMEGFNGHARPLDEMIKKSDYRLFNMNSLKLKRYKEVFPSPGKTDSIDSLKGLELFQLKDHLPLAGDVLQEVAEVPPDIARCIESIPGFGVISSGVLAGEIGNIDRFEKESSLSMYMGMSALDNSSGMYHGSKVPRQVNKRVKAAMMIAVDRHRTKSEESQKYYEKKRAEGKKHNQAIRSLGRHLVRVIFKLLKENRCYEIKPTKD